MYLLESTEVLQELVLKQHSVLSRDVPCVAVKCSINLNCVFVMQNNKAQHCLSDTHALRTHFRVSSLEFTLISVNFNLLFKL